MPLPIGTNSKPFAIIGKFPNATSKLMFGKTFSYNGEEITDAMIGSYALTVELVNWFIYW